MKTSRNILNKAIDVYSLVTLVMCVCWPQCLSNGILFPAVNAVTYVFVIIALLIVLLKDRTSEKLYNICSVVALSSFSVTIWLMYLYHISPTWLLVGLIFTLLIYYIPIVMQKKISVTEVQNLLEIIGCFVIMYGRNVLKV